MGQAIAAAQRKQQWNCPEQANHSLHPEPFLFEQRESALELRRRLIVLRSAELKQDEPNRTAVVCHSLRTACNFLFRSWTMRASTIVLVASLLVTSGCSHAMSSSGSSPTDDARNLQGTWKFTGGTYDGDPIPQESARWIFEGDSVTVMAQGSQEKSQFKLGTTGPNTIWVKHHDNPLASKGFIGGTLTGIYELSGDNLRLCYDLTGQQYPKTFDAKKGSRKIVYELEREKSR